MLIRLVLFPVTWSVAMAFRPFRLAYRITVGQFPNVLAATIAVVSFGFISANFGSTTADADWAEDIDGVPSVSFDLGEDLGEDLGPWRWSMSRRLSVRSDSPCTNVKNRF